MTYLLDNFYSPTWLAFGLIPSRFDVSGSFSTPFQIHILIKKYKIVSEFLSVFIAKRMIFSNLAGS